MLPPVLTAHHFSTQIVPYVVAYDNTLIIRNYLYQIENLLLVMSYWELEFCRY